MDYIDFPQVLTNSGPGMRISNQLYTDAILLHDDLIKLIFKVREKLISGIDESYGGDLVNVTMIAVLDHFADGSQALHELLDTIIKHGKEERSALN